MIRFNLLLRSVHFISVTVYLLVFSSGFAGGHFDINWSLCERYFVFIRRNREVVLITFVKWIGMNEKRELDNEKGQLRRQISSQTDPETERKA
jgi:hypothetical protein